MPTAPRSDERGIALITVMLMTVAIAAVAASAIFLTSSATLISKGHERDEDMRNAADAGIELGRSALNGNPALFPDTGYKSLAVNQQVTDANGNPITGVTRSIYYGPTGSSTGQYGIFGSVVSVIQDNSGALVVRRGELAQESFARFAYFTDSEGSGICFASGDQIFGPLHTNDNMCIYSPVGARFHSDVEVAGTITGAQYGIFDQGYTQHGAIVPLPSIADLAKLNTYATQGGMSFTAPTGVDMFHSRMRIEFVSVDLDGDGRVTGSNEGFFRVYIDTGTAHTPDIAYVTADAPSGITTAINCGDFHQTTVANGGYSTPGVFYSAAYHYKVGTPSGNPTGHSSNATTRATQALQSSWSTNIKRCYLGGDDHLNLTSAAGGPTPRNTFFAADSIGRWMQYTATPDASVIAGLKNPASGTVDTSLVSRTLEAQYLWPLSRQFNPNTKGVIYVNGNVAVSGVLNGRVTLAASGTIMIADDLKYAIAPGAAPCTGANMLGLLSPDSVVMLENTLLAPWNGSGSYTNYKANNDDYLQGVILTLKSFGVEDYDGGATSGQNCQSTTAGRGCLYLTGGIIQDTRGAVGTSSGSGYIKRYAYDQCAFQTPPPYFPTTGRFTRNRYYEIDPVGFNVGSFFASLTPNQ